MGVTCSSCTSRQVIPNKSITEKPENNTGPNFREASSKKQKLGLVNEKNKKTKHFKEAISAVITNKKKSEEDIHNILKTLRNHFIFKNLDNDSQMAILDHVQHYSIGPKEIIFKQGDPGVSFFCVAKGRLEVLANGERTVIGPGCGFGEMALLDDRPRAATIKTIDNCSLWGVDRKTFNAALKRLNEINYAENKNFIESIPIFEPLTAAQKDLIVSALVTQKWLCGQTIIKEGEFGDLFYIIKEGYVICYENKVEKRQLAKGEYFGEQALLHKTTRTATVIAGSDLKVVSIGRESLMQVLGDKLEFILYQNSQLITIDKSPVLRSLNHSQVIGLLKVSKIVRYKAGEVVLARDTCKSNKLVMVLKGCIRGPTYDIGVHSCIGDKEIALRDFSLYTVDYMAIVETDVAEICIQDFEHEIGGEITQVTLNNEANNVLNKVQLLRSLSPEKVKLLTMALRIMHYDHNEIIVQENNPGDSFYIVKSGVVKVFKTGTYIRDITKHDYFGERAVLFNDFRTATVLAEGSVDCWVLFKKDFMDIINENIRRQLLKRIELQDTTITLDELEPIKAIGNGMFGNVVLVSHKVKKTLFAIKTVAKSKIHQLDIYENLILERRVLLQLDHTMILKLIRTFKDSNRVYFLMEYVKGQDLFDVLIAMQSVREESAKFYIACLLITVEHLHDRNIVHRDIKPENVMIDEEGYTKLIDFGTAKILNGRTYTTVGTPHYMAPEVILRNGYSSSVDLWSLGIVLYEIIYGKVPFGNEDEDPKMIYEKILEHKLELKFSPYPGSHYKSFIQQLLSQNPAARLGGSMDKLKNHPWLSTFNWNRLISRQLKPPYIPTINENETMPDLSHKSVQAFISDLEDPEDKPGRKMSLGDFDGWDDEF